MPRQVDHAGRRRLIAEAVCHLADERGLEGVTLRDVAARAQVSMGAVQRCFRTKEEMLVFALGHIGERIGERVRARLVSSPAQSAGTALGHAATELSLLREEHRAEARVWLAFVAQAAVSEALARTLKANYAALQEAFTGLIAEAAESAGLAMPLDPRREARTLLALADGLTAHVLIGHLTPQAAQDVLHAHLARLWEQPA
ncbi:MULTISPECIES: TetR/AcrR family transcriptional regulator [unclassified Streptomyces]|uniref:TetR/AcrR family transcriptional regulator n=1 Tax=unclassified Streptomyces TaxID=2593676 RepID=UPI001BEA6044|nr:MULTISPECIES: TetR/AcrR family transcriptional regulator [unclassified Streptomyces]MBT2402567.1 TetR/AcrR family transcriptional regulator [Streptomyces sp. ISL-21]MBT2454959.1 TetR/AcrR family transcriptional regulator [Streptomyces sp. ISL-86]MBT2611838.1 TetR/AcrR family transcriptional regulator [Streptomyces sp. ISL-87]